MNVKTWKTAHVFDLILVSVLGLFIWNGHAGNIFLLESFVLFRLVISFGLLERKKSNWLPISLFSFWLLLTGCTANDFSRVLLEQPSFDMAKVGMLLLGGAGMDGVRSFEELLADESRTLELVVTSTFTILYWGWILLYPIISYVRQWWKKQFVDTVVWDGSKWAWGLLLLTTGIWGILLLMSSSADADIITYLYLLVVAWGWMISYFKQMQPSKPAVRTYLCYAALFFGAYLIGRETEHFLSLFGLVVVLPLFYKKWSAQHAVPVETKDVFLLVIAGYLFWKCQFFEDILRLLMLGGGLLLVLVQCWKWYRLSNSKALALLHFLILGFVIPVLCIGYNPYAVVDARRLSKFDMYQYSYNGIVQIADGDYKGLRDRYTEILPCKYDKIELAGSPHLPYLKVKEGDGWGLYNMETQKLLVDPDFASIYPYDDHFLKLQLEDGNTYYYPVGLDTRPGRDSLLTYFVSVPCYEYFEQKNPDFADFLHEAPIDNASVHSTIYHYLVHTANALLERNATPEDYWEWAEKSYRLVERLGNEHDLFMSDTASVAHQSIERVYELLYQNDAGSQAEMNGVSFVYAVLELYRALDMNQTVVAELKEDEELEKAMLQEYACWMDYYRVSYEFYRDCIIGNDFYSAQPLDLNGFLDNSAARRYNILVEELSLFKNGERTTEVQRDIALDRLEKYIHRMENGSAQSAYIQALWQSVQSWIAQRERVSSLLPNSYRSSYNQLTQRVKWMIDSDLKWMADEYKTYEDTRRIVAD